MIGNKPDRQGIYYVVSAGACFGLDRGGLMGDPFGCVHILCSHGFMKIFVDNKSWSVPYYFDKSWSVPYYFDKSWSVPYYGGLSLIILLIIQLVSDRFLG
jgi:hypothetical protein